MIDFSADIDRSIQEMKEWKDSGPGAAGYSDFVDRLLPRVEQLKSIRDLDEFSLHFDAITRSTIDSGPLTGDFSPTFNSIGTTLEKLKRRR